MREWNTCDGDASEYSKRYASGNVVSRRNLISSALLSSIWWANKRATAISELAIAPDNKDRNVLVVVFLRGGADGLNTIVPYQEDAYHRERPTLRIAKPIYLDGFFGFHPALEALISHYREGRLAVIHATGSQDNSRSHFEAMSAMERGLALDGPGDSSGWIARHLNSTRPASASPLRAISLSTVMPDSLRGATNATALRSIDDYKLDPPFSKESIVNGLRNMYEYGDDEIFQAGRETLHVLDTLSTLDPTDYSKRSKSNYSNSDLGIALKQIAMLIRASVGLEVACVDHGGWDTHVAQGAEFGWHASQLKDLAESLGAFMTDLQSDMGRVTVVVMTEFGRRIYENTGLGTDHGRASFMLVMGGGVRGGKVYGTWPGLGQEALEGPGDLQVTTDYRVVLAELLESRLGNTQIGEVFAGIDSGRVGLLA
jgi:uncharacterized protein (DUF1501 family)